MLRPKVAHKPSVTLDRRGSSCSSTGTAPMRRSAKDGREAPHAVHHRGAGHDERDDAEDRRDRRPEEGAEQQRRDDRSPGTQHDRPPPVGGHLGGKDLGCAEAGFEIERFERQRWLERHRCPRLPPLRCLVATGIGCRPRPEPRSAGLPPLLALLPCIRLCAAASAASAASAPAGDRSATAIPTSAARCGRFRLRFRFRFRLELPPPSPPLLRRPWASCGVSL